MFMLISIKLLNYPGANEISLEVDHNCTIQEIKSRLARKFDVSIDRQKLVLKGKPLFDGKLSDYQITDDTKLYLLISPQNKQTNSAFINELHSFASTWIQNANERDEFVTAFQEEMKNLVDRLSLDDIEKLCTDRLNQAN